MRHSHACYAYTTFAVYNIRNINGSIESMRFEAALRSFFFFIIPQHTQSLNQRRRKPNSFQLEKVPGPKLSDRMKNAWLRASPAWHYTVDGSHAPRIRKQRKLKQKKIIFHCCHVNVEQTRCISVFVCIACGFPNNKYRPSHLSMEYNSSQCAESEWVIHERRRRPHTAFDAQFIGPYEFPLITIFCFANWFYASDLLLVFPAHTICVRCSTAYLLVMCLQLKMDRHEKSVRIIHIASDWKHTEQQNKTQTKYWNWKEFRCAGNQAFHPRSEQFLSVRRVVVFMAN